MQHQARERVEKFIEEHPEQVFSHGKLKFYTKGIFFIG
jgi:hypothetical protein